MSFEECHSEYTGCYMLWYIFVNDVLYFLDVGVLCDEGGDNITDNRYHNHKTIQTNLNVRGFSLGSRYYMETLFVLLTLCDGNNRSRVDSPTKCHGFFVVCLNNVFSQQ